MNAKLHSLYHEETTVNVPTSTRVIVDLVEWTAGNRSDMVLTLSIVCEMMDDVVEEYREVLPRYTRRSSAIRAAITTFDLTVSTAEAKTRAWLLENYPAYWSHLAEQEQPEDLDAIEETAD